MNMNIHSSFKMFALVAILLVSTTAMAHGDEDHSKDEEMNHSTTDKSEHSDAHDMKKVDTKTLKGKIIGLTCYLQHDAEGEKHKSCAKKCAEDGLPLGFMGDDGKLYQIMGKGHENLKITNSKLLDYIEGKVIVVGQIFEKKGYHSLVIEKIKNQ